MKTEAIHDGSASRTTKRKSRGLPVLLAILVFGFAVAGIDPASAAKPDSPFGALVSGTLAEGDADGVFDLDGSGVAARLGKTMTYTAQVVITGVDESGVITDVLTETFTAANGDTLTIQCDQVATPIGDGVYEGVDEWMVIGGTGRFEGATGSGTGTTVADLVNGTFTKQLLGTISY